MSSAELRGARGFTLVEVMVALVLAGLLAGVIFQVVRGQARFATVQSAQQEVQQNARGAVEIIASELRGVQPQGLIETSATSITFQLPRAWGVSCGNAAGGPINALFADVADATVMFARDAATGVMADTTVLASATTTKWGPAPGTTLAGRAEVTALAVQNPAPGVAGNACSSIRSTSAAAGLLRGMTITGNNLPATTAGRTLYLYQLVRYDVGGMTGAATGDDYWIRRSDGLPSNTSQQPLAGPLPSATGLTFTYFKSNGTAITPGSTRADLDSVARIGVKVVARSRTRGRANLVDSVMTSVLLRNTP